MGDTLIKVEGVSKRFCRSLKKSLWYGTQDFCNEIAGRSHGGHGQLRDEEFWALNEVSFELRRGECLGLIGRNGAGKTTLLRLLNGLIKPDRGRIEIRGRVGALIALGAGFNPVLTGRENIYINASVLGLSRREIDEKLDEIIDFSELDEFIDAPIQSYSSGMQVRLGFSVASILSPDVLILDEVLAVGDADFQAKCFQKIGKTLEQSAVILVSHFPHHIKKLCNRALLLEKGVVVHVGSPDEVLEAYQHRRDTLGSQPLLLTGSSVRRVAIENVSPHVASGGFLEFDVALELDASLHCAQSYINLVDAGDIVHAQAVLEDFAKILPQGTSLHRVRVGPLHLATGRFSGNFTLYGVGGKTTIAHCRHCLDFSFRGPPNLGPTYYPPSSVTETGRWDRQTPGNNAAAP